MSETIRFTTRAKAARRGWTLAMMLLAGLVLAAPEAPGAEPERKCEYHEADGFPATAGITRDAVLARLESTYFDASRLEDVDRAHLDRSLASLLDEMEYDPGTLRAEDVVCLELAFSRDVAGTDVIHFDRDLAALAIGDRDGDGILDFLVGPFGRLYENDTDFDGDEITNAFDVRPFSRDPRPAAGPVFADADGDGIPDHIDWSRTRGATTAIAQIQACLYRREWCPEEVGARRSYGIALVDTDARFELETAEAVRDLLFRVFDRCTIDELALCRDNAARLETLDTIYASKTAQVQLATRPPRPWSSRRGEVLLGNKAMYLYERTNGSPPPGEEKLHDLIRFLTIAHELLHALQYAFDYPQNRPAVQSDNVYETPRFITYMNKAFAGHGLATRLTHVETTRPSRVLFNEIDEFPYQSRRNGTTFEKLYRDLDPESHAEVLHLDRYRAAHYVRGYQFVNVFEWHAVQLEAYLLRAMLAERLDHAFGGTGRERELERMRILHAFHCVRGGAFYEHADDAVMAVFADAFPIDRQDLAYLARRYLPSAAALAITDVSECP